MKKITVFLELVAVCLWLGGCSGSPGLPQDAENGFARFDDPNEVLITSQFVKMLEDLPPDQIEEAKSRLRTRLQSEIPEIRRRAALTLHALGDVSGIPVIVMIRDMREVTKQQDRDNIVVALRVMKDSRAIPVLTESADDLSPYIRSIAMAALGELKAATAYKTILKHLHDYESEENSCIPMYPASLACYALGALGDKRAISHLIEALEHKETQSAACQALGKLTGQEFHYDVEKWKEWWEKEKPNVLRICVERCMSENGARPQQ